MREFSKLAYFAIKSIEAEEPEGSVGGEPEVQYFRNDDEWNVEAPQNDIQYFKDFFKTEFNPSTKLNPQKSDSL